MKVVMRGHSTIEKLPDDLRETVEQMLLANMTYREVVEYLRDNDVKLSQSAVCNYARKYIASVRKLQMTQENMQLMMEELDKYPNLDVTEGILRVASNNLFNAIAATDDNEWSEISPEKMLKQATALARAAAYKKRVDQQLKSDTEAALDAGQSLAFEVIAKRHPELYEQLVKVIREEKAASGGGAS